MTDMTWTVGATPHIRVERVGRDLRIRGGDTLELVVQGGHEPTVEVEQSDGLVVIRARSSLRLRVPAGATLEIGHVGGDLSIEGVYGEVHLGKVGGDAHLVKGGGVVADRIGGDALAKALSGGVTLKAVGGDVVLESIEGPVKTLGVGGDARLRSVRGSLDLAVGGDISLMVLPGESQPLEVSAGGDVHCRLPKQADYQVRLVAGGKVRLSGVEAPVAEWGETTFGLGEGTQPLAIVAGGDILMMVGEPEESMVDVDDLGATIAAKVGEKIAEMEATLSVMGGEFEGVSSERIADRVQRVVDRAVRRKGHHRVTIELAEALAQGMGASAPVTEEERMRVLRLLEEKKISVEEAERLLEALEG
ncbi:MAG TPA: hypothetical protein VGA52_09415 [Anaerolineales bacterium]|jgi:hypothetical protein